METIFITDYLSFCDCLLGIWPVLFNIPFVVHIYACIEPSPSLLYVLETPACVIFNFHGPVQLRIPWTLQISAGMQYYLQRPVINKPLTPLSAGSAATTKKICLLGMFVNRLQQRSRRICIILTPNLIVSHSKSHIHTHVLSRRVLSVLVSPLCSCLQGWVDLCAEREHKGSESCSRDLCFSLIFFFFFWQQN